MLSLAAMLAGGASVEINETLHGGPAFGLDWLVLDSLMMAMLYVPLERLFPRYPDQSTFKKDWTLDVKYWFSTHLPVQLLSFLWILPGSITAKWLAIPKIETFVGGLPWLVQFPLAIFAADMAQYVIHLTFHKVPWLWPFHAIHHSSKQLDWIAGSRSHFVDVVIGRGFIMLPLIYFGFSQSVILAYLVFVTLHATLQHSNFAPSISWLEHVIVMPRHHHWHHAGEKEAIDKDFAIHFPWIDRIFGTYYYPDRWPTSYGLIHSELPTKFWKQFFMPFKGKLPAKTQDH
jgi:lathosterol oxidase